MTSDDVDTAGGDHRSATRKPREIAAGVRGHRVTRAVLTRYRRTRDVAVDHIAVDSAVTAATSTAASRKRQNQRRDGAGGNCPPVLLFPLAHKSQQGPTVLRERYPADLRSAFATLLDQPTL